MLTGTVPLLSPQRGRAIARTKEMVPMVMALGMLHARILIRDDVGLGRTTSVGLVITELPARHMASRLLVMVPADLPEQWRKALGCIFHVPARISSTHHRREM